MNTVLFNPEDIKRWFDALDQYDTHVDSKYANQRSAREVFIHRTLNKWFAGKYFKIIREDSVGLLSYQFITVVNIKLVLDWSICKINVNYIDAAKPFIKNKYRSAFTINVFNDEILGYNDVSDLEGFEIKREEWEKVRKIFIPELPLRTFIFDAWDKKTFKKTTHQVEAYTHKQAYNKTRNIVDSPVVIGELIEIKLQLILKKENEKFIYFTTHCSNSPTSGSSYCS